jgi:hypothetical protein
MDFNKIYKDFYAIENAPETEVLVVKEGTWAVPETPEALAELAELMNNPIPANQASDLLYHLVGDDSLADNIGELEDTDPDADVRPMVRDFLTQWGIELPEEERDTNFDQYNGMEDDKENTIEDTTMINPYTKVDEAVMVSAEGEEAAALLRILKLAGASEPTLPATSNMRSDMDNFMSIVNKNDEEPAADPEMEVQDEWSNSPAEVEQDIDSVIVSGDDLHKSKAQFPAASNGDNPMTAFEGRFKSILADLLAEDEVSEESEELDEAQSPAQKAAFAKMIAAKNGDKADEEEVDEEVDESVTEGRMSDMHQDAQEMTRAEFIKAHGDSQARVWDQVQSEEDMQESVSLDLYKKLAGL